jgi:tRNA wybutosine-synthesizing protein 1
MEDWMDKLKELEGIYHRQGYRIVGSYRHSAVKICEWTREALRSRRYCFKQKWYGIQSHRCLQCTTALYWCLNRCLYCWRSFKGMRVLPGDDVKWDEPEILLDEMVEAQRSLLIGFKGNPRVDRSMLEEAFNPTNVAISLIGESLLYPYLSDFIELTKRRNMTSFLVTKGTVPEELQRLSSHPTNLYISLCSPDEDTFRRLETPLIPDGWSRVLRSLELFSTFVNSRRVIRITLVKGWNMDNIDGYAKLIEKANPDFIEPKAYMWVGESTRRLTRDAMPTLDDVIGFADKLARAAGYRFIDIFKPSRVALLGK